MNNNINTVGNNKSNILEVTQISISNVKFSNGYANGNIDVTKNGYTPLGVVGFDVLTTYVSPNTLRINNNTLSWSLRRFYNESFSGTATANNLIIVQILYIKTS